MNEDSIFLENPDYLDAIVGCTEDGNVIYSFSKMVDCLMREDSMTEEDAIDFIEYKTIRALPYAPSLTGSPLIPIIMYDLENDPGLIDEIDRRRK